MLDIILDWLLSLDHSLYLTVVNNCRTKYLNHIMVWSSYAGSFGTIWIILIIVLGLTGRLQGRHSIWRALGIMGATWLLNDLIFKNLVARPRPFTVYPDVDLLINAPSGFSFPSGHAASSCAAWTVIRSLNKDPLIHWGILLLALTISVSRVYVGVHYPLDVVGGAVLGTIASLAFLKWIR
ncbi:MAG: phosphatase PAP2 family protein [Peptococcaceae bacterium]|nr:phosphatase PAP2 family protein [Peptococcaceae bacterium]